MINYPSKPWEDGQTFRYYNAEGDEVLGTYSLEKNT